MVANPSHSSTVHKQRTNVKRRTRISVLALLVLAAPALAQDPWDGSAPWWRLADPAVPRSEVLKALTANPSAAWSEDAVEILERMIAEDAAHRPPVVPLAELPMDARVAELIFCLRDEIGCEVGVNGSPPDLFQLPGAGEPTTSDRLAALGQAAVPRLVAALDDRRFTRCVGAPRGQVTVVRIGDAAVRILEKIAGRPFGYDEAARDRARAWWAAVGEKGEFLAIADEMALGDSFGPFLAARLAALAARAAAPLVVRAARAEADLYRRKAYLDVVVDLEGPGVEPFLVAEMRKGPTILNRIAAAVALDARGHDDAVPAMVAEWKGLTSFGSTRRSGPEWWVIDGGLHQLAIFLAGKGEIAALTDGLGERPGRGLGLVAQALGAGNVEYNLTGELGRLTIESKPPEASRPAREKALRALLADQAVVDTGYAPYVWVGDELAPLRVADMAARSLAALDPERRSFDPTAPVEKRDEAIRRLMEEEE